jgi:uncharacterized protein YbjT (DUF2867 family)
MRIVIAGGHGQIALLTATALDGDDVLSLTRHESQFDDIERAGGIPTLFDIENGSVDDLAAIVSGADAVVFSAGAGAGSTDERKRTVDFGGAVKLADAAEAAGVRRLVLVSSIGADRWDPESNDGFQLYLRAKGEADENIRARDLDWTIIRPATLANEPAIGAVETGDGFTSGSIPRADVAALIARAVRENVWVRRQFDVRSGAVPIAELEL